MHHHQTGMTIRPTSRRWRPASMAFGSNSRLAGQADYDFHGVPKFTLTKGDPYHLCPKLRGCWRTELGLTERQPVAADVPIRFGRAEWLQPYTDATLALPAQASSGFMWYARLPADCLETLEEDRIDGRKSSCTRAAIPRLHPGAQ